MPSLSPRDERRKLRSTLKVVHRHRVGEVVSRRESALLFVSGRPVALLEWINLGGVRTPLYSCELDPSKLCHYANGTYHYEDVTVDPRF
jgi:hypothetical protein